MAGQPAPRGLATFVAEGWICPRTFSTYGHTGTPTDVTEALKRWEGEGGGRAEFEARRRELRNGRERELAAVEEEEERKRDEQVQVTKKFEELSKQEIAAWLGGQLAQLFYKEVDEKKLNEKEALKKLTLEEMERAQLFAETAKYRSRLLTVAVRPRRLKQI